MSKSLIVVAAHPDDEVLGCGATVRQMVNSGWTANLLIMTNGIGGRFSDTQDPAILRQQENLMQQSKQAAALVGFNAVAYGNFEDNRMDVISRADLSHKVREYVEEWQPDVVFTHHPGDYNWDHTATFDAVMMACRPNPPEFSPTEIRTFEVLSSTERAWQSPDRAFLPNLFTDVKSTIETKKEALRAYQMEYRDYPHPRSVEAIEYLARKRGNEIGIEYAEAFHLVRKLER